MEPIIILGMHRSGTSLVAELLRDLGLFIGNDLNVHQESNAFLKINEHILSVAHTYWDYPLPMENLINEQTTFSNLVYFLKTKLNNKSFKKEFWGLQNIILNKVKNKAWGWKEPRTTITFPLWMEVFPHAKFIYVYRNGIDVAASLHTREVNRQGSINSKPYSLRCLDFDSAFRLWEEYNTFFFDNSYLLKRENLLMLSYEDLLIQPKKHLGLINNYIDININKKKIPKIINKISPSNAYKFLEKENLKKEYTQRRHTYLMNKLNYSNIL